MARVCMGRGQQLVVWLLGLLGVCSPGTMVGEGGHGCCGAGKWARGEPTTCLGLAVPLQRNNPPSSTPCCQQGPPSKDNSSPHWVSE